jgi:1D-myo-inositol-tetrakisphosphate 5-kinase/inositol-polyphosphate multikinase
MISSIQAAGHEGAFDFRGDVVAKKAPEAEVKFYQELFAADQTDPMLLRMRDIVPKFYDIEGSKTIIIENLTAGMVGPSVIDMKLGARTYYASHSADYKLWHQTKAKLTTSHDLGFRIQGFILRDEVGSLVEAWPRHNCLLLYGDAGSKDPLRRLAEVNGVVHAGILSQMQAKTQEMLDFFNEQRSIHFISMSVVFFVDKHSLAVRSKLIDFAHTEEAAGELDKSKD